MAIRYEIEVPLRMSGGAQFPPDVLRQTVAELDEEFGTVRSCSVYRPRRAQANSENHAEWIRLWFEARDVSTTHEWIAAWLDSTASRRFGSVEILVAWYHPVS